jgi:biofilm protein TabA
MILIALADRQRIFGLHPLLPQVFAAFDAGRHHGLPDGRHGLVGERLAVIVEHGQTKDPGVKRLETHRRHIDVQIPLTGGEVMQWTPAAGLDVLVPYDAGKDIAFYHDPPAGLVSALVLPGTCAVFFPEDAHKPGCHPAGQPAPYGKLVFKLAV